MNITAKFNGKEMFIHWNKISVENVWISFIEFISVCFSVYNINASPIANEAMYSLNHDILYST